MASKSRKRSPIRERRTSPEASDFLADYTPFHIDTSAPPLDAGPRIPLFYVDDREYSVPERIPAGTAVKALEIAAENGPDAAAYFMVVEALGEEAVEQLTTGEASKRVDHEQVRSLFRELGRRYFGQMEDLTGK